MNVSLVKTSSNSSSKPTTKEIVVSSTIANLLERECSKPIAFPLRTTPPSSPSHLVAGTISTTKDNVYNHPQLSSTAVLGTVEGSLDIIVASTVASNSSSTSMAVTTPLPFRVVQEGGGGSSSTSSDESSSFSSGDSSGDEEEDDKERSSVFLSLDPQHLRNENVGGTVDPNEQKQLQQQQQQQQHQSLKQDSRLKSFTQLQQESNLQSQQEKKLPQQQEEEEQQEQHHQQQQHQHQHQQQLEDQQQHQQQLEDQQDQHRQRQRQRQRQHQHQYQRQQQQQQRQQQSHLHQEELDYESQENSSQRHQHQQDNLTRNSQQVQQKVRHSIQPDGWRVKLYRLNSDGSWDDCGTGRITCVFSPTSLKMMNKDKLSKEGGTNTSSTESNAPNNSRYDGKQLVCTENSSNILRDSDITNNNKNNSNNSNHENDNNINTVNKRSRPNPGIPEGEGKDLDIIEDELYYDLSEPTLCMHAELTSSTNNATTLMSQHQYNNSVLDVTQNQADTHPITDSSSNTADKSSSFSASTAISVPVVAPIALPKVLLRTRVLLRDVYQRQGDNIITWCEPSVFPPSSEVARPQGNLNNSKEKDNNDVEKKHLHDRKDEDDDDHSSHNDNHINTNTPSAGVDLALSFQDNAGCLDIWNKIKNVQRRARDLYMKKNAIRDEDGVSHLHYRHLVGATIGEGQTEINDCKTSEEVDDEIDGNGHSQQQTGTTDADNYPHKEPNNGRQRENKSQGVIDWIMDGANADNASNNNGIVVENNHQVTISSGEEHQSSMCVGAIPLSGDTLPSNTPSGSVLSVNGDRQHEYVVDDSNEHELNEAQAVVVSMAAAAAAAYRDGDGLGIGGEGRNGDGIGRGGWGKGMLQGMDMSGHGGNLPDGGVIGGGIQLPNPPSLANLEEIADIIAAAQLQQREAIASFITQLDCAYLKSLVSLFPSAEAKDDYHALATLASIVKAIVLLNYPGIIELITSDGLIFEKCCCCLEYDPDLRDKANHRWFLHDRLKFRTVLRMEDKNLIETIHRAFRVTYLRDTLLRPTMDENSLSSLASLLTFTHADVVKGVTCSSSITKEKNNISSAQKTSDSYLVQILRVLGREVRAIRNMEWDHMQNSLDEGVSVSHDPSTLESTPKLTKIATTPQQSDFLEPESLSWEQHIAPQDASLTSRKIRRRGCLSFLRELFNMVRTSLQQTDKDNFYAMIADRNVDLDGGKKRDDYSFARGNGESSSDDIGAVISKDRISSVESSGVNDSEEHESVNLLSLLGVILSDPNSDVIERGACLEILSAIAMHDPSIIRKLCLEQFSASKENGENSRNRCNPKRVVPKPEPNDRNEVIFYCSPNDLLLSLIFVITIETDAGVLLQTSEIVRIILDTEMMNDHGQLGGGGVMDNEDQPIRGSNNGNFFNGINNAGVHGLGITEQDSFLTNFYEQYVPWLVAPFQYTILIVRKALQFSSLLSGNGYDAFESSQQLQKKHLELMHRTNSRKGLLQPIVGCSIRTSFTLELLSFCVRAHCYRMKIYVIKYRVLKNVLKSLGPNSHTYAKSGNRCLKLAILRFLRSVLAVKDDYYIRHIIQLNLFSSVFETFRANPVGDNLVSSVIIEMCDYITIQNIKPLIEYIVTKHLCQQSSNSSGINDTLLNHMSSSLEDKASPYVDTLNQLKKKYEENVSTLKVGKSCSHYPNGTIASRIEYSDKGGPLQSRNCLSEKALEEQRKFREADEEESYFNDDDDDDASHSNPREPSHATFPLSRPNSPTL